MATSTALPDVPASGCTILPQTSWAFYERFLQEYDERRIPHSYVNGELRIMSPSFRHESPKRFIACLIDALTEELPLASTARYRRRPTGDKTTETSVGLKWCGNE